MERPDWISPPLWRRFERMRPAQPEHAADALCDWAAATAGWTPSARSRLIGRVLARAELGVPLPAALVLALGDALDD